MICSPVPEEKLDLPESGSNSLLDVLGKTAGVLVLITACLFFAGYLFLDSYYASLGVPIWLLDLPAYTYPIYSVPSLLSVATIFVSASFTLLYSVRREMLSRFSKWISEFLVLVLIVALFEGVFFLATRVGLAMGKQFGRLAADPVCLAFKPTPSDAPRDPQLLKANKEGRLRMITQTKDLVIVFEPSSSKSITTFVIPRSELTSVREINVSIQR